jgi:hypothetical protein
MGHKGAQRDEKVGYRVHSTTKIVGAQHCCAPIEQDVSFKLFCRF